MIAEAKPVEIKKYTRKELTGDHPTWCPGCGDFSILSIYFKMMERRQVPHRGGTSHHYRRVGGGVEQDRACGRGDGGCHAIDVDLDIRKGETLGIVGESGSGKTTLGLALLRLERSEGGIAFDGQDLQKLAQLQ